MLKKGGEDEGGWDSGKLERVRRSKFVAILTVTKLSCVIVNNSKKVNEKFTLETKITNVH